ncbi:MAG TPA: urea ABC transporter permease subunit UrtB [Steroidobacteraceae bacterium]|nr:urea ABC transporter permease subunit UrtB [Steroidobacteraceae bacterium]
MRPALLILVLGLLPGSVSAAAADEPVTLSAAVQELKGASYGRKAELVRDLAALHQAGTKELLQALLDGEVYARTRDGKVFIVEPGASGYALTDPLTGKGAGTEPEEGFEKIGINNSLRRTLRGALAQFDLSSPDKDTRVAAVKELLKSFDDGSSTPAAVAAMVLLREQLAKEHDGSVQREIRTALALADLGGDAPAKRLAAIETLASSLNPAVYKRLVALTDPSVEADAGVRNAAARAVRHIDGWRQFYSVVEMLFFGLSLGSVLVLAAIGLAITFGVVGVINMAHGELMMIGAYTAYVMQLLLPNAIGTSIVLAVPAAFVVAGLVGVLIERFIVRYLYGRPLETLLATCGLSLILQQMVRDIFTANNRPVRSPQWMAGSLQINDVLSITYNRLVIVLFTLAVFAVLQLVLKRTRLGLEVRAVAQNRAMARAMGVRTDWVDALTFGLGSGLAGVAGVALSQLTNVGPNLGQSYIVDSFMVVVFGGVGNLWGTLIGGMSLGVVNKILEPVAGAVLGKIAVLTGLILFIQRRPRGLFPQQGRAAES